MMHVDKQIEPFRNDISPDYSPSSGNPGKRLIIFLIVLFSVLASGLLALLYIVPYYGFSRISPHLPLVMGILAGITGVALLIAWECSR